jgi:hypothetical protein
MRAHRLASLAIVGLLGLFTLGGCAPYFKGVGAIPSLVAGKKAVFAFALEGPKKKLKGVYDDQGTGTFFYFEGLVSWVDNPGVRDECMQAVARYRSKIKGKRGEGQVQVTACDNGNPGTDPTRPKDQLAVQILSGPMQFTGPGGSQYVNGGELIAGDLIASNRPFDFKEGEDRDDDRGEHGNSDHDRGNSDHDRGNSDHDRGNSDHDRGNSEGNKARR